MNELERELRDMFHSRIAVAERPRNLLPGTRRRAQRRLRQRIAVVALAAVAVIAAVAVTVTLSSGGPPGENAITSHHGVPAGWVPVAFGGLQIWVPPSWAIRSQGGCAGPSAAGVVYGGTEPRRGCALPPNVVRLSFVNIGGPVCDAFTCPTTRPRGAFTINGLLVLPGPAAPGALSVDVVLTGIRVTVSGPLARRALSTLALSPAYAVLAAGPKSALPAGWRWHVFGGIQFAAPAGWPVERTRGWDSCSPSVIPDTVLLSTANTSMQLPCGPRPGLARFVGGQPGIVVGAGPLVPRPVGYLCPGLLVRHGFCYDEPSAFGTVFTLFQRIRGQRKATIMYIGLSGTGITAQTIYDSIRPYPRW